MKTAFALDLKVARRRSGLSQNECAHLAGCSQSAFSDLEAGTTKPSMRMLCVLSLLYGRSFPSLFETMLDEVKPQLMQRLESLPKKKRPHVTMFNRSLTLNRLKRQLVTHTDDHGSA